MFLGTFFPNKKKNDIGPVYTDNPILYLLVTSDLISKTTPDPFNLMAECNTCSAIGGQHGSWYIFQAEVRGRYWVDFGNEARGKFFIHIAF